MLTHEAEGKDGHIGCVSPHRRLMKWLFCAFRPVFPASALDTQTGWLHPVALMLGRPPDSCRGEDKASVHPTLRVLLGCLQFLEGGVETVPRLRLPPGPGFLKEPLGWVGLRSPVF